MKMNSSAGFSVIEALIIVLVLAIFIGGGLFLIHNAQNNKQGITKAIYNTNTTR